MMQTPPNPYITEAERLAAAENLRDQIARGEGNFSTNKGSCASSRNGVTLAGHWGMARFLMRENATASPNSASYSCIAIIHQRPKQHKRTAGGLRSNIAPSTLIVSSPLHGVCVRPPVDSDRWALFFFSFHFS